MKRSREPEELLSPHSPDSLALPHSPAATSDLDSRSRSPSTAPEYRAKIASLSPDVDAADSGPETAIMTCLLHREHIDFPTYEAYETHYNKEHLNRCIECRRNFPSPMYLSLHGDEWHDPFVAVKREKGEHTYACFVEGCDRKCRSMDKRRRHLIDKHSFPNSFFFLITQYGTDGRQSLLDDGRRWQHRRRTSSGNFAKKEVRRRAASVNMTGANGSTGETVQAVPEPGTSSRSTTPQESDTEVRPSKADTTHMPLEPDELVEPDEKADVQMDDLAGAMSSMTFIPRSVRFGRGGGKAGFARR